MSEVKYATATGLYSESDFEGPPPMPYDKVISLENLTAQLAERDERIAGIVSEIERALIQSDPAKIFAHLKAALTRATSSKKDWVCRKCLWSSFNLTKEDAISFHKGANKTLRIKCRHEPTERPPLLPPESSEVLG